MRRVGTVGSIGEMLPLTVPPLFSGAVRLPRGPAGRVFGHGLGDLDERLCPRVGHGMEKVEEAWLSAEACRTLALIHKGGLFPYAKHGTVSGTLSPSRPARRGYYHEYTVRTLGERYCEARRVVMGQGGEVMYTDDHYNSSRAVLR